MLKIAFKCEFFVKVIALTKCAGSLILQEALKFHHDSKQERGLRPIVMPIVVDALEKNITSKSLHSADLKLHSTLVFFVCALCPLTDQKTASSTAKRPFGISVYALLRTGTRYVLKLIRSILAICSSPSKLK